MPKVTTAALLGLVVLAGELVSVVMIVAAAYGRTLDPNAPVDDPYCSTAERGHAWQSSQADSE